MDVDDWRSGKPWAERYMYMLDNEVGCDITFSLEHERRVQAHKFILISRSAVFEAMFCGSLAETSGTKEIKIPDIESGIFLSFLRFLYISDISLTDQNTLPILYVARKYCVEDLVRICAECLRAKMTPETVCEILEQAHTYDIDDLKNMCLQYIYENGSSVLHSEGFQELCFDCVKQILQSDDLFVEESDVYTALVAWSERECRHKNLEIDSSNKRQALGKLLFCVRFPTMDRLFFTDVVSADDILTDREKIALFQHMFGSSPDYKLPFSQTKREARVIRCFRFPKNTQGGINCEPGFKNSNFGIDVRASDDVMLQGLILFGATSTVTQPIQPDEATSPMNASTSSITDQHLKIVVSAMPNHSETYTFEFDNVEVPQQETYALSLREPVLLKKNRMYAIHVKLDLFLPYQTYSGKSGLGEVDSGSIKFNFYTHQSLIATTADKGQIAGLLFSKLPEMGKVEAALTSPRGSPRGSPVKRDLTEEFRPIFVKRDIFD